MSTRRLVMITTVPMPIKKAFRSADDPSSGEERLWRERAARMTLDALGHTNLTVKPHEHNEAVRYARRWFRGMYDEAKDTDSVQATFDFAGVQIDIVRREVLAIEPIVFEPDDGDDDDESRGHDTGRDHSETPG